MEAEDYAAGCCFSLMCQEDGADLGDGLADDDAGKLLLVYSAGDDNGGEEEDEEGYLDHLVSKESSFCSVDPSSSMASEDWFQCARRDTVRWILETRGHFGFSHRTAYVAIAYFDRFSLRRCVDRSVMPWAARLLAIACVSLAAKMDECQAPALSEFRADDDYDFSCDSIRRMEMLVLSTLDWRMGAVTPFDYLPCLSSRLRRFNGGGRGGGGGLIAVKAAALIFSAAEGWLLDNHIDPWTVLCLYQLTVLCSCSGERARPPAVHRGRRRRLGGHPRHAHEGATGIQDQQPLPDLPPREGGCICLLHHDAARSVVAEQGGQEIGVRPGRRRQYIRAPGRRLLLRRGGDEQQQEGEAGAAGRPPVIQARACFSLGVQPRGRSFIH
ncbi:hypothetical protein VPH35_066980 [Triticum aestivum]|uniref:Cyclin-like domain-containing protein n=1 Tax=Triticum turgidum subsp. durum TaxID=4567 RepID=A0A9R0SFU3_TRITD|nr:cyclin-D5-1-like isoform X1 [Triticum aestivum]VAH94234.1 unnamed protein product [Triticum turgidum subsp. durum]